MEQNRIILFQGMVKDGDYNKDIDAFNTQYFSNSSTIKDLWKKLIQNREYTKTLKDFYVKYACDLPWAKKTTYCGGSGGGGNTSGFPEWAKCLQSLTGFQKRNENVVVRIIDNGDKIFFSKSGKVQYIYKSGNKELGNWRCNGTKGYLINMDNGDRWDGTKWIKGSQNNGGGGGNTGGGGSVSQGWLADPTGNKTWEYQLRDCKWIARKIGKTTEYSISDNPKYQSSVNILNGKYSDLVKDCNKPDQTQPDSQNVVTGGGQQPGQTGSSSSTGNQPASNQTQGLGTPNSIDLGLDEILKLGNPVKTNPNNTQVPVEGVPTTQQESIKVNTDVLKEEFYSTLKKLS